MVRFKKPEFRETKADAVRLREADEPVLGEVSESNNSTRPAVMKKPSGRLSAVKSSPDFARRRQKSIFLFLFCALFAVSSLQNRTDLAHAAILDFVSQVQSVDAKLYSGEGLVNALQRTDMPQLAAGVAMRLVKDCTNNPHCHPSKLCFARLLLLKCLISQHDPATVSLVSAICSSSNPPALRQTDLANKIGQLSWEAANQCVPGDRKSAEKLYAFSKSIWKTSLCCAGVYKPVGEGELSSPGHKCFMLSDAALNSEHMGKLPQALNYAKEAVESAEHEEHWVATAGQAERITKLAYYLNKTGSYTQAKMTAEKALNICREAGFSFLVESAQSELREAQDHLSFHASAKVNAKDSVARER